MIFDIVDVFKDDLEIIVVVSRSSFKKRIVGKGNDEDDVFFLFLKYFKRGIGGEGKICFFICVR